MAKILIVEDDIAVAESVFDRLTKEKHVVDKVFTCTDGKSYLESVAYDLLLLDWELPDGTGIEICQEYRAAGGRAPILFLTGRSDIGDRITGLDTGADDYLVKPFDMSELASRVRALLRRQPMPEERRLSVRDIVLDSEKRTVHRHSKEVKLFAKEFNILELLMRHPGRVFSADELLDKVWHTDAESSVETVRTTMLRLRQKIDTDDSAPLIRTIRNMGYRLEA